MSILKEALFAKEGIEDYFAVIDPEYAGKALAKLQEYAASKKSRKGATKIVA
ncbi:MAG: hypothetical protein FWG10_11985 [Eubacteriaceae bacterium]|nr:hypothetical protein [Eubacteriaceae bacterium]